LPIAAIDRFIPIALVCPNTMRVTANGMSEYHNGNEVGRCGRDENRDAVFVHYHDGLRKFDEPAWMMDTDVEWKVSVSVDTILVADNENGLYAVDREAFKDNTVEHDGRTQHIARASDDFVTPLGDLEDHLQGGLWITPENAHGGYHKAKNES